ncbi:MAG: hydrogenase 2 operon protein HybA [bacterium]|nr:hydrogenase 2 operon protein HybA [bacterium]
MSVDRRTLLKGLAVAGAGAAAGVATPASATTTAQAPPDAVGMLYDATRCIGCRACVTACKQANDLPGGLYDPPNDLSGDTKNIIKRLKEDGEESYMKAQCMHCIDPGCASACMIGAFKKRELGIITWDGSRCIGCRYCQVACPYGIPKFQWATAVPKIVKCELCHHIIVDENGDYREGALPGCCKACPKEAVIFGRYTDLLADAQQRIAAHPDQYWPKGDPVVFGEHDGGGTQVLYLASMDFEALGLPNLGEESTAKFARNVQHGVYKGFIAPVALYGILGAVMWRNRRTNAASEEE